MRSIRSRAVMILVFGGIFAVSSVAQTKAPPPNIVCIVADDLGWKNAGFHDSDIGTPRIGSLAQGIARLESLYTQPLFLAATMGPIKDGAPALPNYEAQIDQEP